MSLPHTVASIEARMGSSRFPGKVLMDVGGKPALTRLFDRLRSVALLDDIVLATTTSPGDDALEAWARDEGVACYRGSEDDVLARVVEAQESVGGELVVEVTGDCTLLPPDVVTLGIETFHANHADVVSNCGRVQTFPMGADVQMFPLALLVDVAATIDDPAVCENVSLHFYDNPDRYRIHNIVAPAVWRHPDWHLQLDYDEDLAFIRAVYAELEPIHGPVFGLPELMNLLHARPDLVALNIDCEEKAAR
ncbi:MAG: glycosyltransferase family protein [Alphaproteobacteria bacterium]|nr:glycosyltransferase family protein [Rhodospirillaceae bacterium]MBT6509922.1 glycosyltransferase family protein [Rhodospirillaceae bacterium]MBT7649334.1 glycosyltransferase family protein [Rhodospirillaceae bacterium]MDG2481068.1 glycosyltransferase family protein [Alphaproteobacteria bacterium]